eukprot:scaffold15145_cov54-Phaeocystis_antarctica.AAC.5
MGSRYGRRSRVIVCESCSRPLPIYLAQATAVAEAYFSEGKQHNAAGDFWAAREYFVHAYVAAPSHALLLSVATPLLALTNTPSPTTSHLHPSPTSCPPAYLPSDPYPRSPSPV